MGLNKGQQHKKVLPSSLRVQRQQWGPMGRLGQFLRVVVVFFRFFGDFLLDLGSWKVVSHRLVWGLAC